MLGNKYCVHANASFGHYNSPVSRGEQIFGKFCEKWRTDVLLYQTSTDDDKKHQKALEWMIIYRSGCLLSHVQCPLFIYCPVILLDAKLNFSPILLYTFRAHIYKGFFNIHFQCFYCKLI